MKAESNNSARESARQLNANNVSIKMAGPAVAETQQINK